MAAAVPAKLGKQVPTEAEADDLDKPTLERKTSSALKNYAKWREVERHAWRPIEFGSRGFLPMKLPYDAASPQDAHTILHVKAQFSRLGLVLDLQNQDEAYSCNGTGVAHQRVPQESKKVPSLQTVRYFCDAADAHWARHPTSLVAVHCHYGFNRTGFLICCYLIEREGWDVERAILEFQHVRAPGIKHQHFKDELRQRYGDGSAGKGIRRKGSLGLSVLSRRLTMLLVGAGAVALLAPVFVPLSWRCWSWPKRERWLPPKWNW